MRFVKKNLEFMKEFCNFICVFLFVDDRDLKIKKNKIYNEKWLVYFELVSFKIFNSFLLIR